MPAPNAEEVGRIRESYWPLFANIETRTSPDAPLLLAHYTSVQTLEVILRNSEIWFSNPLYMNDLEELRAGVLLGGDFFPEFAGNAAANEVQKTDLITTYNRYADHFADVEALDTYIFCLCEHAVGDDDDKLSMWREYGSKGNGAALVFNTQKVRYQPNSPLIIAKVAYQSRDERNQSLRTALQAWADTTKKLGLTDDRLFISAYVAFELVRALALVTKHKGFSEEGEWRVIYAKSVDQFQYFTRCQSYYVGPRGVEPKLKVKFGEEYKAQDDKDAPSTSIASLTDLVEFILLGPTTSSPLARAAFIRMLDKTGQGAFRDRVRSSGIPLRPSL